MSEVIDIRVFQSAVRHGQRIGMQRRDIVHAVAEAQRDGASGFHVAGQLQHRAIRAQAQHRPDGDAA